MNVGEPLPVAQGDFVYRQPLVPIFTRAAGAMLYDDEGHAYLDAEASNGAASLGFDASLLTETVSACRDLPQAPAFVETDVRLRLAARLKALMLEATGLDGRVAFELGGAQGIELALRVVARNSPGSEFLVFEGAYHGRSVLAAQLSASPRYRSLLGGWRLPVTRLPYPDCEQCRFSRTRSTCALECVHFVDTLTRSETSGLTSSQGGREIAAFLFEPLLNVGGVVQPDPAYLHAAVNAARRLGGLVVVDEIFTGFGRTGPMFGFQRYGIVPDVVVFGKALTNGITPLTCVWARDPYLDPDHFPPGTHSVTYLNNVFSLAVAHAVLDRHEAWKTREADVSRLERALSSLVTTLARRFRIVRSGNALGGVARLLLEHDVAAHVVDVARTIGRDAPVDGLSGVLLGASGLSRNVVALSPPLTIDLSLMPALHELLVRTLQRLED